MDLSRRRYLRLISGLYLATFLIRTSFGVMLIAFYYFLGVDLPASQRPIGEGLYGTIVAFSPIAEMLTVLLIGVLIDRRGRRGMLLLGLALGSLALFMLPPLKLLPTGGLIVGSAVVNALHGISAAMILVSSLALLADYAPATSRGREMGAFDAINLMGWMTGFALGLALFEAFRDDVWLCFVMAGLLALVGLVYAFFNVAEPEKQRFTASDLGYRGVLEVLRKRAVVLTVAPWFVVFILIGSLFAFLAGARGGLGISGYELAQIVAVAGIGIVGTQTFYGKLSDRHGRMPILLVGAVGFAGLMATVGLSYVGVSRGPGEFAHLKDNLVRVWPLIGVFGLMALAFGPAALASLADVAQEKRRGITMGLYTIVIALGMAVGPIATGYVYQYLGGGGVLAFFVLCGASMLAIVLLKWLGQRRQNGPDVPG